MTVRTHDCCDSAGPAEQEPAGATARRFGPWAAAGSVASAALASACCWLPAVLLALGLSAGGLGGFFAKFRPLFLGVAVVFLATGFYFTYFRKAACDRDDSCAVPNAKLQRFNRLMLWAAVVAVGAFALFPAYAGLLLADDSARFAGESEENGDLLVLKIEGMTCEGCAAGVEAALREVEGVQDVAVAYDRGEARVLVHSDTRPSLVQLRDAVRRAGYSATPHGDD